MSYKVISFVNKPPISPPEVGSIFYGLNRERVVALIREGLDEAYQRFFGQLPGRQTTINHVVIDVGVTDVIRPHQTGGLNTNCGVITSINLVDGNSGGSGVIYRDKVGRSQWYMENTGKLLRPDVVRKIGETPNAIVLDFAAGAGVVSIGLLEEMEALGLPLDTLILVDIVNARKHLLNAIDGIKPFLERKVLRELKVFTLNKDPNRVVEGETRFAVPSQIQGLIDVAGRGIVDFVIAANCFHLLRDDIGVVSESLAHVTKPGGQILINSTNIRPEDTPSNSLYLEDIFVKLRERLMQMANDPTSRFHPLKYLFDYHQQHSAHAVSQRIDQGIPPGPDLDEVINIFERMGTRVESSTSMVPLTEEDGRVFYRGMYRGYDRIMVPEGFKDLASSWLESLGLTP